MLPAESLVPHFLRHQEAGAAWSPGASASGTSFSIWLYRSSKDVLLEGPRLQGQMEVST